MRAAIIPADPAQPIRVEDIEDNFEALGAVVGGFLEAVGAQAIAAGMYINEEGKIHGLARNDRATLVANVSRSIRSTDYIAGDAVLLGLCDDEGNDTDLPLASIALLGDLTGCAV